MATEANANDLINDVAVEYFSQRVRWKCIAELVDTRGLLYFSKFLSCAAGFKLIKQSVFA
jgi:hypothetical protein